MRLELMATGFLHLAFILAFHQSFACWFPYQITGYFAFG
jgi:hypothetical protein